MTLESGTRLGPYELVELLGQGGMGAVYRADDTRLDRAVAVKVLAGDFTEDSLARFQREARTVAALSHPNICTLFDVGRSEDIDYLVMELVEGRSLDQVMAEGLSVAESIGIAREISLALESAHASGVVHRDLKPANVMVCGRAGRSGGSGVSVKVLDFGLAKAREAPTPVPSASALANSPTLAMQMTEAGVILGTAAYMSPEQARGQDADPRGDIWAWGVMLFEMLSGRPLFAEPTVSDTLASVLRSEIPWDRLPGDTPVRVREVLEQCLERDRDRRFHAMADARLELERSAPMAEQSTAAPGRRRALLPLAGWTLAAVASLAWLWTLWAAEESTAPPGAGAWSFDVELPASFDMPWISPDGAHLVASTTGPLQLRAVASREWAPIPGTDGAKGPFWSPDSRQIAFFQGSELKRISLGGTLPERVASVPPRTRYGHWSSSGDILIETPAVLPGGEAGGWMLLRAGADTFEKIRADRPELISPDRSWPQILPDGQHVLFTEAVDGVAMLQVVPLGGGAARPLTRAQSRAVYTEPGFVLYVREGRLLAQRFDLDELEIEGPAVQIADRVNFFPPTGAAPFSVSRQRTLVYDVLHEPSRLVWLGRQGQVVGTIGEPALYEDFDLSPDGDRMVTEIRSPETGTLDLWLFDLGRGVGSRLTSQPRSEIWPVWSPDGRQIAYGQDISGPPNLFVLDVGTGTSRELVPFDNTVQVSTSWSPDGRHLLFHRRGETGTSDIWLFDFESGGAELWLESPFSTYDARFSPDGRWVSYVSTESGVANVFLRPFPGPGPAIPVSDRLGMNPRWASDGTELYFRGSLDNDVDELDLIAVAVGPESPPRLGVPQILFPMASPDYVPGPSGDRFLTLASDAERPRIQVLLDWTQAMDRE